MPRYIDADKLKEEISHITVMVMGGRLCGKTIFEQALNSYREEVFKIIENAPTADVVPKRIGIWKPYKDYFTHRQIGWICSNCSVVIRDLSNGDTNYCPDCGALMESEEENE